MACNDKDHIWMNEKIKSSVTLKNQLHKVQIKMLEMKLIFQILKMLKLDLTSFPQPLKHHAMKTLRTSY